MRRFHAYEDATGLAARAVVQIPHQGFANVVRDRETLVPRPLASFDVNLSGVPVDIVERQLYDLTGPKAQPREQKQDCMIAASSRRFLVATLQETFDVSRLQELRDSGEPPKRHGWHTCSEIDIDLPLEVKIAEERAQHRRHHLCLLTICTLRISNDELTYVLGPECIKVQVALMAASIIREKLLERRRIGDQGSLCEPTFPQEKQRVLILYAGHGTIVYFGDSLGDHIAYTQMIGKLLQCDLSTADLAGPSPPSATEELLRADSVQLVRLEAAPLQPLA
jgi:hypothetical protein